MSTLTYMYAEIWKKDNRVTYRYTSDRGILDESRAFDSIDDLAEGYSDEIRRSFGDDFQGRFLVVWEAPTYLQEAVAQVDLEAQHSGVPAAYHYGVIDPKDRKRIQELLPEGVLIDLE